MQCTDEDVAFQRLNDLHREMENSRSVARSLSDLGRLIRNLAARAWWLSGVAMQRPPRRSLRGVRQRLAEAPNGSSARSAAHHG
jgi:hypothetical protein